jgi:protein TonB
MAPDAENTPGGKGQNGMKGKSMYKTGTMILAVAMSATAFSAAPALGQDRERTSVEAPNYPRGAERRRVEGYAVVQYTVAPDGTVENPTVIEAEPEGVFDRAVLHAIEGWSYAPAEASTEGVIQRFDFSLDS